MFKKAIKHIRHLRYYLFLFLLIVFFSYLSLNPISVSQYFGARFGSAVGMSISVPENPFNKLALQLREKEDKLNQRERQLDEREKRLNEEPINNQEFLLWLLSVGIVVLFILIIMNYFLDFKRRRELEQERKKNQFS